MDDLADAAQLHLFNLSVKKALIAPADAHHPVALVNRRPHHGADCGIHTRGVAAAGEDADGFILTHNYSSCFLHGWKMDAVSCF